VTRGTGHGLSSAATGYFVMASKLRVSHPLRLSGHEHPFACQAQETSSRSFSDRFGGLFTFNCPV
jgi:hypothetical protein